MAQVCAVGSFSGTPKSPIPARGFLQHTNLLKFGPNYRRNNQLCDPIVRLDLVHLVAVVDQNHADFPPKITVDRAGRVKHRYPEGSERQKINDAFGKLFDTIQTKETDKGVALYNKVDSTKISPSDKAIYGMAAEGKSAAEILKFIATASRNPFNRQVAKLLLKTGINCCRLRKSVEIWRRKLAA